MWILYFTKLSTAFQIKRSNCLDKTLCIPIWRFCFLSLSDIIWRTPNGHVTWAIHATFLLASLLNVPGMKTEFDRHAFSCAAPQIWKQIQYLFPLESNHSTVSNTTLKQFHHSTRFQPTYSYGPLLRFKFILTRWWVNKFITLHFGISITCWCPAMHQIWSLCSFISFEDMLKGMPVIIFVLIRQKSKMAVTEMKYTYFTAV